MNTNMRRLLVAAAVAASIALVSNDAFAQRGGRGGGGGSGAPRGGAVSGGGGRTMGPGSVGTGRTAVPRGGPVHGGGGGRPIHGGGGGYYGGGYRPVYAAPAYWGGWGLGWGWGGYWGYGAWGWWGPGWWGPGYASSLWWPGFGWWGAPALYAPPYGWWGITSEARFMVQPRNTEVYIDGALAGIVDQYDGAFQSLTLTPGTHEITFYLEGHKKQVMNAYVAPGSTLKVRHTMEKLAAGAPEDERPSPPARPQPAASRAQGDPNAPSSSAPQARAPRSQEPRRVTGDAGLLVIRVQPGDAEVLIDGQAWEMPENGRPLEVRVPSGLVRVEVRKPGYAPFSTEVTVTPGEVTPLNVSLPSRGQQL